MIPTYDAERFSNDTASHEMTVLRDDGLYRHLRFAAPGTGFYWFDLVTWPGHLAIVGDVGPGYTFSRLSDMFEFFRGSRGINPSYWAEKILTGRDGVREYSEARFRQIVMDHAREVAGDYPPGLVEAVRSEVLDDDTFAEDGARLALRDFTFTGEAADGSAFSHGDVFVGSWEWDFRDWGWSFLWCCHAIQWGIRRYDAARTAVPAGVSVGGATIGDTP